MATKTSHQHTHCGSFVSDPISISRGVKLRTGAEAVYVRAVGDHIGFSTIFCRGHYWIVGRQVRHV